MIYCWLTSVVLCAAATAQTMAAAESQGGDSLRVYHQQARRTVRDVLAEREFAQLRADPYGWLRAVMEWLQSALYGVRDTLEALPRWIFWLVVAWMVITLVAILAHLVYTLYLVLGGSSRRAAARAGRSRHEGELFGIRELEFESVYARARALLAESNWTEAIKYFYVSAILWLDRQGRIAFRHSKTNYDYLRELRATEQQAPFRQLTEQFEATVYGANPVSGVECQGVAAVVEGLVHETAGGTA